jgi:hypothetical protein
MEGLHVPKGKGARKPLRLRKWQRAIVRAVLAPGIRTAVVAIPRGNGKSTLAAALGLWALVAGPEGLSLAFADQSTSCTHNDGHTGAIGAHRTGDMSGTRLRVGGVKPAMGKLDR